MCRTTHEYSEPYKTTKMLNTVNYFRKTLHHDIWQGSISKNITRDKYTLDRQYFDKYILDRQYFDKYLPYQDR